MSSVDGSRVAKIDQWHATIPYKVADRIRWLLGNDEVSLAGADLVHALGLPSSYASAMPRILQKLSSAATAKGTVFRFRSKRT